MSSVQPSQGRDLGVLQADGETVVFRPRTVRIAGYAIAALVLAASIITAVIIPGFSLANRAGFVIFGLTVAWFCHREASVKVVAGIETLTVRNLITTRTVEWAQVVAMSFPAGNPWALMDLSDGETISLMALQRADGSRGLASARRLTAIMHERGDGIEANPRT